MEARMSAANELMKLLDAENTALRAGRIDDLAENVPRKQGLSLALSGEAPRLSSGQLVALRRAIENNERLLAAAGEGLRRVINRMKTRNDVAARLDTYDASGRRLSHAHGGRRLERRT